MKRFLIAVSLVCALASCNQPEEAEPAKPASKDSEIEITVTADDFGGPWENGAAISVFDNTGNHKFTTKGSGSTATFNGSSYAKALGRLAVSPYQASARTEKDTVIVSIPSEQKGFEPVSAAWSSAASFRMAPVCGAISFSITDDKITRVEIEGADGELISGPIRLWNDGKSSAVRMKSNASGRKIILYPAQGDSHITVGEHRIACCPVQFQNGVKVTFGISGAQPYSQTIEAVRSVSAGSVLELGELEIEAEAEPDPGTDPTPDTPVVTDDTALPQEPAKDAPFDLELVFIPTPSGTDFNWPFVTPDKNSVSNTYTEERASFPKVKTAFKTTSDLGGYVFQIYATTGIAKNSGGRQGLKFGGAAGDYIQLPAIKGVALTSVTWVTGGAGAAGTSIVRWDGEAVPGGDAISGFGAIGETFTWSLYGSQKETAYKICTASTGAIHFQRLILHYDTTLTDDPSSQFQEVLPDQIPDFSRVGYHYGDKEIPDVPVKMTLEAPSDGSDAKNLIQNAINTVETPGAILLKAGTYNISDIVRINRSGVVLRGEGEGKTILYCTATTQVSRLLQMGNTDKLSAGTRSQIIAKYVPVGQMWVPVRNPEMFSVGESVWIYRPATEAWLDALHMRELAALYSGNTDWTTAAYSIYWERKITAIDGYKIYLDNPVVMCIGGDPSYGTGYLCKGKWNRVSECGIENMTLDTRYDETKKNGKDFIDEDHCWSGIAVYAAEHSWVRNVTTKHFGYCSVDLATGAKHITVTDCTSLSPVSVVDGGRRYAFHFSKSQLCLIKNCLCDDDRHQYVCGAQVPGPNVFHRCTATNVRSDAGPHQRWASGTLYDNVKVAGKLYIQDRAGYGTGHGWAGVNFVCWNCETGTICVQSPWATGQNWAIGCIGTKVAAARSYSDKLGARPDGIWQSPGTHVSPESIYEDQLSKRHAAGEYLGR